MPTTGVPGLGRQGWTTTWTHSPSACHVINLEQVPVPITRAWAPSAGHRVPKIGQSTLHSAGPLHSADLHDSLVSHSPLPQTARVATGSRRGGGGPPTKGSSMRDMMHCDADAHAKALARAHINTPIRVLGPWVPHHAWQRLNSPSLTCCPLDRCRVC